MKIHSYSSCGVVLTHGVDIGSVDVAAAAARDSDEIRYGSWKFVFADFAIVGGSEDSGFAMFLACNDCCYSI